MIFLIYNNLKIDTCPFTDEEISELDKTRELLIYLPSNTTMQELCEIFGIKSSVNFFNETMINNVMVEENQWFITSSNKIPEFLVALEDHIIHLENYGKVLKSAYGKEPPEDITKKIKK